MKPSFRDAAIAGSSICFALAAIWIGAPQFVLWIRQFDGSQPALLMACAAARHWRLPCSDESVTISRLPSNLSPVR